MNKIILFVCAFILLLPSISHPDLASTEYKVKSAYMYNFLKFTDWRNTNLKDSKTINICIFGRSPINEYLNEVTKKTHLGKDLTLRQINSVDALSGCHEVFISRSEAENLAPLLNRAVNLGTLTVSDIEGFAKRGGIIEFVIRDNKVRFRINIETARRSNIRLGSQLLELAEIER